MRNFKGDLAYADSRLRGSFVKKDGRIIRISRIDRETGEVEYFINPSSSVYYTSFDNIDLSPIKLGNVSYKGKNYYTLLVPARQYRQGLRSDFVVNRPPHIGLYGLTQSDQNKYLGVDQCLDLLENGEATSLPWSRYFSIHRHKTYGPRLFYKGNVVGEVDSENASMKLNNDKLYLAETLEEGLSMK